MIEEHGQGVVPVEGWSAPDVGWFKLNTDASFSAEVNEGASGVVLRDHSGVILAAAGRWYDRVPDVLTAEAMAARDGVALAADQGCEKGCAGGG